MLDIRIKSLLRGAQEAEGIVVIVDVFRAGTNISLVLGKGAERILPVASLEESLALMEAHPEYIFMGERDGKKIYGFHYGNSPSEIDKGDFYRKTVSINTTSGTQGIANVRNVEQLLIGGFVNSPTIEEYVINEARNSYDGKNPVVVTIVPMGWGGETKAFEDEAYAAYLRDRLLGRERSFEEIKEAILKAKFTQRFFDPTDKDFLQEDLDYCLTLGRFDNVPRVYKNQTGIEIRDAKSYNSSSS